MYYRAVSEAAHASHGDRSIHKERENVLPDQVGQSVGSNPGHGEVVFFWAFFFFFFFLLTSLSLTCTGKILDHKVTHSGRDKERKK